MRCINHIYDVLDMSCSADINITSLQVRCAKCKKIETIDILNNYFNKEVERIIVEEIHTFAKPEEVNNLDFPNSSSEDT